LQHACTVLSPSGTVPASEPSGPPLVFSGGARLTITPHIDLDDARRDSGIAVQFYGMFRGSNSIRNVCRQWVTVLTRSVDGFGFHDYARSGSGLDESCAEFEAVNPDAAVAIYYGMPTDVPVKLRARHEVLIGAFVCETDRIPADWVENCNRFDLVVVPSRFCQQVFTRCGVTTPVMVIPHGIESEYAPAGELHRGEPFVFYNTFAAASFAHRKGAGELVRGFLRAFTGRGDVILRLRTEDSPVMRELRQRHDFGDQIRLEPPQPLDTAAFAALYGQAHCTVHPSLAEGFGLIPFQSIACGTPVIATAATGMADYLNPDNAMVLRTAGRVAGTGASGQSGYFPAVDEDHLVELLRHAVEHWEAEYAKVRRASEMLRERYRWERVLEPLAGLLNDLAGSENLAAARARLAEQARALNVA
jgi:glycosyltransferase involved in cell wall biosynthesis